MHITQIPVLFLVNLPIPPNSFWISLKEDISLLQVTASLMDMVEEVINFDKDSLALQIQTDKQAGEIRKYCNIKAINFILECKQDE